MVHQAREQLRGFLAGRTSRPDVFPTFSPHRKRQLRQGMAQLLAGLPLMVNLAGGFSAPCHFTRASSRGQSLPGLARYSGKYLSTGKPAGTCPASAGWEFLSLAQPFSVKI